MRKKPPFRATLIATVAARREPARHTRGAGRLPPWCLFEADPSRSLDLNVKGAAERIIRRAPGGEP